RSRADRVRNTGGGTRKGLSLGRTAARRNGCSVFLTAALLRQLRAKTSTAIRNVRFGSKTDIRSAKKHAALPLEAGVFALASWSRPSCSPQGSRIRPVVRLIDRALECVRYGQLDVDALRRDRSLEPLNIELLELARAHQLGERVIDQCLELRIVLAEHQRIG